jgi:hypothetical protein
MWFLRPSLTLLFLVAACGPGVTAPDDSNSCESNQTRCVGAVFQTCDDGHFTDEETCASASECVPGFGCGQCDPLENNVCVGNDLHRCNDGTLGDMVTSCSQGCLDGACVSDGTGTCDAAGVKLIYVVDVDYNFLSFDPGNGNVFRRIGELDCPAGDTWPDFGDGPGTPFSMSVDRNGTAWVLYSSGEIFHVSTADASCTETDWNPGEDGYQLFGMGFVADTDGGDTEKLFIAGGAVDDLGAGNLAWIDPADLTEVHLAGELSSGTYNPELTGTGAAEIYAYTPSTFESKVARLNRADGTIAQEWTLEGLGISNEITAWAFAHWGGKFYTFVTTKDLNDDLNSQVWELDPADGMSHRILQNLDFQIVGAGVSTCAPIEIE